MNDSRSVPAAKLGRIVAIALFVSATPAAGQTIFSVEARIGAGVTMPEGAIPFAPVLASPTNVLSYERFESAPSIDLGLEFGASGVPATLRLSAAVSRSTTATGIWGCASGEGDPLPCPAILIEVDTRVRTSLASADVIGSIGLGTAEIRPLLGAGWVRYSYSRDPAQDGTRLEPGRTSDGSFPPTRIASPVGSTAIA